MEHIFETEIDHEVIVRTARIGRDEDGHPVVRQNGEMITPWKGHIQEMYRYRSALQKKVEYLEKWCADAKREMVERLTKGMESIGESGKVALPEPEKEQERDLDESED